MAAVEKAENMVLDLRKIFSWILVALFALTVLTMMLRVGEKLVMGEIIKVEVIVPVLGTVMLLTLVADGFKISSLELEKSNVVKTVLQMAMIGVVGNILYNSRFLTGQELLEFLPGFVAFALILFFSATAYGVASYVETSE